MPGGEDGEIAALAEASPGPATVNGKVRLEFTKYDRMKYLPHLSLMRTFHRALRRAKVPVAYSQGHTPHPKIQPGPPLPIGYEGDCEYIDIETSVVFNPAEITRRLNACLPEGIEIRRAVAVHARSRSLFDMIDLQTYRVILPKEHLPAEGPGDWLLSRLQADDDLNMEKTRRGKVKTVNLRPSIARAELTGESGTEIEILLSLHRVNGSAPRPGDVIRVAGGFSKEEEFGWKITRTANLVSKDEQWNTPINLTNHKNQAKTATCRR
jgi:radical SAM-linked protein